MESRGRWAVIFTDSAGGSLLVPFIFSVTQTWDHCLNVKMGKEVLEIQGRTRVWVWSR